MKEGGAKKLRRSRKKTGYYTQQYIRTTANKTKRARKRTRRKEHWLLLGKRKNGKSVRPIKVKSRSTIIG